VAGIDTSPSLASITMGFPFAPVTRYLLICTWNAD
jgi:hypothetical protein